MEEKMSRWGVGPVFAALSIGYGMIVLAITIYFYPVFQIDFVPYWLMSILGISLLVIGVPFFIISVITVMRAYNADQLVTDGIFRCCRHPLYASWVIFIVPGTVLLINSWIGMTAPVFMFVLLRILVIREETYLVGAFGVEYLDYKKTVPCIWPYGMMKKDL
ncbi:MAG: isoprenylcysteine carboxylmethyltransferase family protein [Deltaproteobacteria bacterium]|nr:isoprenylcysteine carboxylmethyltransferase family protein [Deltaproteobacteria bacterium]